MGTILSSTDYPAIRAKLGVDTGDLPDADIASIGLLTVAEVMIKRLATDYASLTGDDLTLLKAAAVNLCAALAIPKLEIQNSKVFHRGEYSEAATAANWGRLRETLMAECRQYLLMISTHVPTGRPVLFTASGPTSSAASWPVQVEQWIARVQPALTRWMENGGLVQYGWEVQP